MAFPLHNSLKKEVFGIVALVERKPFRVNLAPVYPRSGNWVPSEKLGVKGGEEWN